MYSWKEKQNIVLMESILYDNGCVKKPYNKYLACILLV